MGLAAIDDALDALRADRPVVLIGLDAVAPGIVVWSSIPPAHDPFSQIAGPVVASTPGASVLRGVTAEAGAADLVRLTGLGTTAHWAPVPAVDGPVPDHSVVARFADDHQLAVVDVADVMHQLWRREPLIESAASARLPLRGAEYRAHVYRSLIDGVEHIALTLGDLTASPLVRVHSECITGDLFGSERCDCGAQMAEALDRITAEGRGVLVYLRDHEGRGIGLVDKLRAYELQDQGLDTVAANEALGHEPDARHFGAAAQILRDLGVGEIRLLTNNPLKVAQLTDLGVEVASRVPLVIGPNAENRRYLEAKRSRLGHLLDLDDA